MTTTSSAPPDCDSYLSLIPRGFHHSVRENLHELLTTFYVDIGFVGEPNPEPEYVSRIAGCLQEQRKTGRRKNEEIDLSCVLPVGTIAGDAVAQKRNVSIGYLRESQQIWSCSGELSGTVWVFIKTNAPVDIVARLRILGPLIALVNFYEGDNDLLPNSHSLEEAIKTVEAQLNSTDYPFIPSLKLWHKHVNCCWNLSKDELDSFALKQKGLAAMKYRLSCIRSDSDNYKYKRQQFLANVADIIVPRQQLTGETGWKVDLTQYDLEIVILVRQNAFAVGFAVKPYRQLKMKSFASGSIPQDVNPPYLSGEIRSSLVRLRPSTSQMLLNLAEIKPCDVVLDPCAGVGTIPMEVIFHQTNAFALGGDIVLTTCGLGPLAATYSKKAHMQRTDRSNFADLMAWDATNLPLRDACVDVVVSDLPFGQQCLSKARLASMLPLMFSEIARVLQRNSGKIVLLCGHYHQVIQCLQHLNSRNDDGNDVVSMPCKSIFPVNIGGLQAWVVIALRGSSKVSGIKNHRERVRKLTGKREHMEKCQKKEEGGSKKRSIQS